VDEGIKFQLLTRGIDVPFEFLLNRFPAGSTFGEGFHTHEGTESALLLEGELKVEIDDEVHHLKPGDTLTMKSSIPHRVFSWSTATFRISPRGQPQPKRIARLVDSPNLPEARHHSW
jgi:uncharacterized cupin superfamily protein